MTAPRVGGPGRDEAATVVQSVVDIVTASIQGQPRSKQRIIGPSEIGVPCDRALVAKVAQLEEPPRGVAWKPATGTAWHAQMEQWFTGPHRQAEGWSTEHRVMVGHIGGQEVWGTADLWHEPTGTVWDHKFVGPTQLTKYKSRGPGEQYRTQAHLYARGFALAGLAPRTVVVAFFPRDGEFTDAYFWSEAYQPDVAAAALRRANHVYDLIHNVGAEQAMDLFDPCELPYCTWCAASRAISTTGSMFQTTNRNN